MSYQPFLIANYQTGLNHAQEPWLLPKDAFQEIEDGQISHGIISKRDGYKLFGKLNNDQVTGIYNFVTNTGTRETLATDTKRLYRYDPVTNLYITLDVVDIFNSNHYMWFCNYGVTQSNIQNILYMTNFNDNIRSYITGSLTTTAFIPQYGALATDVVASCLMMFTIKGRLLLLSTYEGNPTVATATIKPQRARWSQNSNPNIWSDYIPGQGGFVDAPTGDFIISARLLKDYLVVFFSNSTWSLRPTSDPALPFRWDKINNFRSCDATFGTISYDQFVISFGKTGIVACSGNELQRIDQKIDDFTSDEVDAQAFEHIFSDRDFNHRRSWTLYSEDDESGQNTKALIRSDDDGSWSIFNISLSCVGQGESFVDYSFQDFGPDEIPLDYTDETLLDFSFQQSSNLFLGGDYAGNIYILEEGGKDLDQPIPFSITGAAWNPYKEQGVKAQLGYVDIYADVDAYTQLNVDFFINDDIIPYTTKSTVLVPEKGYIGDINLITNANPAQVSVNKHNLKQNQSIYVSGIAGMGELDNGPYNISIIDENNFTLDGVDSSAFTPYLSGGIVSLYNTSHFKKVWKRVYAGAIGYNHTVKISALGVNQNIQIHSITPYFRTAGNRLI